jgi:acid stress-induced BolA-like protein IbaG/YrbA
MVTPSDIKNWIEEGLVGAKSTVSGDGHHFEAVVVYAGFQGKTKLQQHRIVYDALGDKMKQAIHALSMKTFTPDQAQEANITL